MRSGLILGLVEIFTLIMVAEAAVRRMTTGLEAWFLV